MSDANEKADKIVMLCKRALQQECDTYEVEKLLLQEIQPLRENPDALRALDQAVRQSAAKYLGQASITIDHDYHLKLACKNGSIQENFDLDALTGDRQDWRGKEYRFALPKTGKDALQVSWTGWSNSPEMRSQKGEIIFLGPDRHAGARVKACMTIPAKAKKDFHVDFRSLEEGDRLIRSAYYRNFEAVDRMPVHWAQKKPHLENALKTLDLDEEMKLALLAPIKLPFREAVSAANLHLWKEAPIDRLKEMYLQPSGSRADLFRESSSVRQAVTDLVRFYETMSWSRGEVDLKKLDCLDIPKRDKEAILNFYHFLRQNEGKDLNEDQEVQLRALLDHLPIEQLHKIYLDPDGEGAKKFDDDPVVQSAVANIIAIHDRFTNDLEAKTTASYHVPFFAESLAIIGAYTVGWLAVTGTREWLAEIRWRNKQPDTGSTQIPSQKGKVERSDERSGAAAEKAKSPQSETQDEHKNRPGEATTKSAEQDPAKERHRRGPLLDGVPDTTLSSEGILMTKTTLSRFAAGGITDADIKGMKQQIDELKAIEQKMQKNALPANELREQIAKLEKFTADLQGSNGLDVQAKAKLELARRAAEYSDGPGIKQLTEAVGAKSSETEHGRESNSERSARRSGHSGRLAGALILSAVVIGLREFDKGINQPRPILPTPRRALEQDR